MKSFLIKRITANYAIKINLLLLYGSMRKKRFLFADKKRPDLNIQPLTY